MIAVENRVHRRNQAWQILDAIGPPAEAFLAQRPIEAFNLGLLRLLVRTGNTMPGTIGAGRLGNGALELPPPVSL